MRKKNCVKIEKKLNENAGYASKERHILFYSVCAVVPVFITGVRIKEIECAFHFAESG